MQFKIKNFQKKIGKKSKVAFIWSEYTEKRYYSIQFYINLNW